MKRALRYPLSGLGTQKILVIGGLLLYYERFIIIPGIFVLGYLITVLRESQEDTPPDFVNWFDLAIRGLKAQIIRFTYLVAVPVLVVVLTAKDIIEQGRALNVLVSFVFQPFPHVLTVVGYIAEFAGMRPDVTTNVLSLEPILVFVGMLYVFPAALQVYATEERFRSAFAPKRIRGIVTEKSYVTAWIQFITLWLASIVVISFPFYYGSAISEFLVAQFGVGFIENLLGELVVIFAATLGFYLLVAAYYAFGSTDTADIRSLWTSILPTGALNSIRSLVSSHTIQVVIIGGLLLSTQLLPIVVFVAGYLFRVIGSGSSKTLPPWTRWAELARDGIGVIFVWFGYIVGPILVLLSGQPVLLPRGVEVGSLRQANAVVGSLGVIVGPPLAYELDRVIRDTLIGLQVATLSNNPYLVRDVRAVSVRTWLLFIVGAVIVSYFLPAALYRAATTDRDRMAFVAGFDLRAVLSVVSNRRYGTKWIRSILIWLVGSGSLIAWYVWRRHRLYTGGPGDTALTPIDVLNSMLPQWAQSDLAVPVPTVDGILSTTLLLLTSMFCFYCLVWGHVLIASGCDIQDSSDSTG